MSEISKLDQNLVIKKIDNETVNLQVNDNEMLMSIVGQFDQNLKDLAKLSNTDIFFRGNSITCKGKNEDINVFCEAIKFLLTQQVSGVFDIGTGISTPLKEITDFFNIKVEERIGDEHERLDNIADISKLRDLGWEPKVKLFEYLKQKRDLTFPQNLNIINN